MVPDNISTMLQKITHLMLPISEGSLCYADITQQVLSTPGSGNNWIIVCQHRDTGRYKNLEEKKFPMFVCPCVPCQFEMMLEKL